MSDPDSALWDRIRAVFRPHQIAGIDHTPQMALDRIAAKCLHLSFNPSNCSVRETVLSLDELRPLKRYHTRDQLDPQYEHGAIVVLVYHGERVVIDGNTRVNKWVNEHSTTPRSALIIEPNPPVDR